MPGKRGGVWPPGTVAALRRRLHGEDVPMPQWPEKQRPKSTERPQTELPIAPPEDRDG